MKNQIPKYFHEVFILKHRNFNVVHRLRSHARGRSAVFLAGKIADFPRTYPSRCHTPIQDRCGVNAKISNLLLRPLRIFCGFCGMPSGARHILISLMVLSMVSFSMAGVTGKIAGRVTEKGIDEGLPGANVIIKGTTMGTATNIDGYYFILNVPPGTYAVEARMMGYNPIVKTGVKVTMDLTTTVDFALVQGAIEMPTIEIVSRKPIQEDVTYTLRGVTKEELTRLPVETFQEALSNQAGNVTDVAGEMHVRGGRGGEVLYMIDGMSIKDPLVGGGFGMRLGNTAIEEMAVITGGFNAEYGEAQSGVVNLVTREGGEKASGSLLYLRDHLGKVNQSDIHKIYSQNSDRIEFSLSLPQSINSYLFQGAFLKLPEGSSVCLFFSGDYELSDGYLPYPYGQRNPTLGTDSAPVMVVNRPQKNGDLFDYHRRGNEIYTYNTKLTFRLPQGKKLNLGYRKSKGWRDRFDKRSGYRFFYIPEHCYKIEENSNQTTISWTHPVTKSASTFYTLNLSRFMTSRLVTPGGKLPSDFPLQGTPEYEDIYGPANADTNKDGFYDRGYDQWCLYHKRKTITWQGKFDLSSQINEQNLVKTGLEIKYFDVYMGDLQYPYIAYTLGVYINEEDRNSWPERGVFRNFYRRYPWQGAVYVQDKIETKGMVVNLGLRFDFFYVGQLDSFSMRDPVDPSIIYSLKTKSQLSPRLGISYPITASDRLFFNYGLFSQTPEFQYFYETATQTGYAYYGNPELKPEKTTQYELGVEHAFGQELILTISGFFKDIRGLIDMEMRKKGPREGHIFSNLDYGSIRGLSFSLQKRYGRFITGSADYTLQWAYGKSSSDRQAYDYDYNHIPLPVREFPLDWDERHSITVNFDFRVPEKEYLKPFGLKIIPDNWGVNILWTHGSGLPYTPTKDGKAIAGIPPNSKRKPYSDCVDLKFNKDFKNFNFWKYSLSLILQIHNLFDRRNVLDVDTDTGTPEGDQTAPKLATYNRNPANWGPHRQIEGGIAINF